MLFIRHHIIHCHCYPYAWVLWLSVFPDEGSCMLPKRWTDSSRVASVCETFDKTEALMYGASLVQQQVSTYVHVLMRVYRGRGMPAANYRQMTKEDWMPNVRTNGVYWKHSSDLHTLSWKCRPTTHTQSQVYIPSHTHTITCLYIPTHTLCKVCCYDNSTVVIAKLLCDTSVQRALVQL